MKLTAEVKARLYAEGKYELKAPPVPSGGWDTDGWIRYIDSGRGWLPEDLYYPDDKPLIDHPFYQWMLSTYTYDTWPGRTVETYKAWVASLGYGVDEPFSHARIYETCKYAMEMFSYHGYCPGWDKTFHRSELFTIGEEFSLYMHGRATPTKLLNDMVGTLNLVYSYSPSAFYFSVGVSGLFIKYQCILGQYKVCNIYHDEWKENDDDS